MKKKTTNTKQDLKNFKIPSNISENKKKLMKKLMVQIKAIARLQTDYKQYMAS